MSDRNTLLTRVNKIVPLSAYRSIPAAEWALIGGTQPLVNPQYTRRLFSRYAVSSPIKRALDIVGALALLVLMGPILICAAAAVLAVDGGPVVYRHRRVGRDGERFDCLKLRSMRRDADAALRRILANDPAARAEWEAYRKLRRDPRVLPLIGMLLRRTSLDELPQLFNVLWGRMSLVGPRPVTVEELERYGEVRAHYLAVRPGLSGRWQVSGRSDISFGARTQIDRRYVETATLGADLWILLMTPLAVLFGRGSA